MRQRKMKRDFKKWIRKILIGMAIFSLCLVVNKKTEVFAYVNEKENTTNEIISKQSNSQGTSNYSSDDMSLENEYLDGNNGSSSQNKTSSSNSSVGDGVANGQNDTQSISNSSTSNSSSYSSQQQNRTSSYRDRGNTTSSTASYQGTGNVISNTVSSTVVAETTTETEGTPFSIPGNAQIVDHITDGASKEFYTIRTENNNTFYLVVDHAQSTQNVYMLSDIDEYDLRDFVEDKKESSETASIVIPETKTAATTAAQKEKKRGVNKAGLLCIVVLAVAGVGGYFFLKLKPELEEEYENEEEIEFDDKLETVNEEEEKEEKI